MSTYISAIEVSQGDQALIGSALYGTCSSLEDAIAKEVILPNFDSLFNGITIQVKFVYGNTVSSGATLKVGSTNPLPVIGNFLCGANQVLSFTHERISGVDYWYSHHNISGAMPISGGTFTGPVTLNGNPSTDFEAANKRYVDDAIASIGGGGATGVMHFRGTLSALPSPIDIQTYTNYGLGDIVAVGNKEYIYNRGAILLDSEWIEIGDEDSYALKNRTADIEYVTNWDAGEAPTLGTVITADKITNWDAGTAASATVVNGILRITNGTAPQISYQAQTIPNVTDIGRKPSLSTDEQTVIIP